MVNPSMLFIDNVEYVYMYICVCICNCKIYMRMKNMIIYRNTVISLNNG